MACLGRGVVDLTGLENFKNLSIAFIYNNQISDVSPLSSLANLDNLYLDDNQIVDVSPFSSLKNLGSFDVQYQTIYLFSQTGDSIGFQSNFAKDLYGNLVGLTSDDTGVVVRNDNSGWSFAAPGNYEIDWNGGEFFSTSTIFRTIYVFCEISAVSCKIKN